jgi:hypothetical protein
MTMTHEREADPAADAEAMDDFDDEINAHLPMTGAPHRAYLQALKRRSAASAGAAPRPADEGRDETRRADRRRPGEEGDDDAAD